MSISSGSISHVPQTLSTNTAQKPPLRLAVGSPIGDALRTMGYAQDLFEIALKGEEAATKAMEQAQTQAKGLAAFEDWKTFRSMLNGALGIGQSPRTKPTVRTDDAHGFPFINRCKQLLADHLHQRGGFPIAPPSALARYQEMLQFGLTTNDNIGSQFIRNALKKPGMNVHHLKDVDGTPMLPLLAQTNKDNAVKALLKVPGIDVNQAGPDGQTALHWAAAQGDLDTLQALLDAGANPNLPDEFGQTPLHSAVGAENLDNVEVLLNTDATNPNLKDGFGQTPLHWAVGVEGQDTAKELVNALLAANANPTIQDDEGKTPQTLAQEKERPSIAQLLA